jgi:UDP-2,4-diacetamido-2,4,6-trideoxy-beta-L-altropyranose hydrolase
MNLARTLRRHGADVHFVTRSLEGNLIGQIRAAGFPAATLPAPACTEGQAAETAWLGVPATLDANETFAVLDSLRPDWLVADHYGLDQAWEREMRAGATRILVIDDLANRQHDCDVLVDHNIQESPHVRYASLVPRAALQLVGPDYALLGSEYAALHDLLPARDGEVATIVAFFGGVDRCNLTSRLLHGLSRQPSLRDIETHVIVSEQHASYDEIVRLAHEMPQVRLHPPRPSLASLFATADLAIGAGGVTMLERCCLGLPSLVVTVADNQVPGAKAAHDAGLLTWLGNEECAEESALAAAVEAAVRNERRADQSRLGSLTVDGRGSERVAAAMGLPKKPALCIRRARPADEHRFLTWANDPDVRRLGFADRPIDPRDHHRWFAARLRDVEGCRMFIFEHSDGLPLAQVRFERRGDVWTIGYSVERAFRGRGVGGQVLERALADMEREFPRAEFVGVVKLENTPSRRIFERLGFTEHPCSDHPGALRYVRTADPAKLG